MSKENIKLFLDELSKNKDLQLKVDEITKKHNSMNLSSEEINSITEKEILSIAKEFGFEFTLNELHEYSNELNSQNSLKPLSPDELKAVSGGAGGCLGGGGSEGGCACAFIGYGAIGTCGNTKDHGACVSIGVFTNA